MRTQTRGRQGNGRAIRATLAGAVLSVFLLSACGGGGDGAAFPLSGGEQGDGGDVSAAGVTLALPEGWAFLDNGDRGMVVAERLADLTAMAPQGPRLTVEPGNTDPPDPEALVSAISGAGTARVEVVEEPDTVSVGAEEGVAIELLEDDGDGAMVRRYVIVNVDGSNVYQFVLEAPEDGWDDSVDTLEGVLESAEFGPLAEAEPPAQSSTLEDYFRRLDELNDEFGRRSVDLEAQIDKDIAAITTDAEAIDLMGPFLTDTANVLEDFIDALDELNPPPEVEETHDAVVTAGRRTVDAFRGLLGDVAAADSAAGIETLLSDPGLQDEIAAFNQTCSQIQAVADESGIAVDLNCGQE